MNIAPDENNVVVHEDPVWRDRSNFIIHASLEAGLPRQWEQLWARQLSKDRFEICCIPFAVYDLALGDEVETEQDNGLEYVVKRVVKDSGRYTFRVWSGDSHDREGLDSVVAKAAELRCEVEWCSVHLIAVSADASVTQEVADCLWELQQAYRLEYETGRTRHPDAQG